MMGHLRHAKPAVRRIADGNRVRSCPFLNLKASLPTDRSLATPNVLNLLKPRLKSVLWFQSVPRREFSREQKRASL